MEVEEVLSAVTRIVKADKESWRERQRERSTLPHVTLTYAQSLDGSIAAERGTPTILSGAESMKMTHTLRTLHDAIMVGIGTILADNPSLNTRLVVGQNPKPVIVDAHLHCPLSIKLLTNSTCEKPILLCAEPIDAAMQRRKEILEAAGATVLTCRALLQPNGGPHIDLRDALERLHRHGIESVMVEGGASVILACLQESARSHFIDRVIVTVAPTFIGGLHAVGSRVSNSGSFPRLVEPTYLTLDHDLIILGKM